MNTSVFNPDLRIHPFLEEKGIDTDLRRVITAISRAGKHVAHAIRHESARYSDSKNPSGERQIGLDIISDDIFEKHLRSTDNIARLASEEKEDESILSADGKFSVAFDPLDGSSLVSSNLAIGSIFGVYAGNIFLGKTGRDLVAAGYILYGPQTVLLIATKKGVWEFTENAIGEFLLSREKISLSKTAEYFAPGNLRAAAERSEYATLMNFCIHEKMTLRYSGGMVPDCHLALTKGSGLFCYPSHSRYPSGKLRLLYECAPFAFISEEAGGVALDEDGNNILDIPVNHLHQRTSIFWGSRKTVERALEIMTA